MRKKENTGEQKSKHSVCLSQPYFLGSSHLQCLQYNDIIMLSVMEMDYEFQSYIIHMEKSMSQFSRAKEKRKLSENVIIG